MTMRHLLHRLLRHRLAMAMGLAGTSLVLAAAFALTTVLQASVSAAVEQSVEVGAGGRQFAVQVLDQERALPVLSSRTDLLPVVDDTAVVSATGASSPADVRAVADPAAGLGLLVDGRHPDRPGQATVSSSLAAALDLAIGDEAVLTRDDADQQRLLVTGTTSSPAHAGDLTVVLMQEEVDASAATVWLTDTDPFADDQLRPLIEQRALTGRTVAILAQDEGVAARQSLLSALGYAAPTTAALSGCLILSMLAVLSRRLRRDVDALQAAGMTVVDSWRLVGHAAALAVGAGAVAGTCLALAAGSLGRTPVSAWLGQDWQSLSVPWSMLAAFTVGLPALVLAVARALPVVVGRGHHRRLPEIRLSPRWATAVVLLWVVLVALTIARVLPVGVGGLWGAAAAFAAPVLIVALAVRGAGRGESRVVRHVTQALMPVVMVAALLTWTATSYAAEAMHNGISMRETSAAVQPPGSLLVYEVPSVAGAELRNVYRDLGGERVMTYLLPDESAAQVRATSAGIAECMRRDSITDPMLVDPACVPDDSASPMNIVALSPAGTQQATLTADPSLMEQGRLGLLVFTPQGQGRADQVTESPATADPLLGGNMPGAVVPADGELARSLDLRATDGELVAFLDFAALPTDAQARFRSHVSRLAGGAQVAEERHQYGDVAIQFSLSRASAIAGATLLVLLLGFGGATVVAGQAHLRRTLVDTGSLRRRRRALAARVFATPVLAVLLAAALGRFSAWLQGVHNGLGFGWVWVLPGCAAAITCAALALAFYRVPPRTAA
ncbi:hypothetical protein ACI8AG_10210 [Blastococcus sp. SYSU DS0552]